MKHISPCGPVRLFSLLFLISLTNTSENETGNLNDLFDNDVHTGNAKHAEMLFQLSINKSEEGLRKLLGKIDENNDQIISQNELTFWILKSNDGIEEKEAKMYINQYDRNDDNGMSWEEYFQHYYGSPTLEFAQSNSEHKEIIDFVEMDKIRFQSADENKDGILTIKELRAFLHPHNHLEMLGYEAMKILKDYDTNKDSKISKKEFVHTQYGGVKINPLQKTRITRIFDNYDSDKDDMLSLEEVKMWLKPDVDEFAKTEAMHLMKVSDVNHDSKVTKEEILASFEHWINSKATNFGDHIQDEL